MRIGVNTLSVTPGAGGVETYLRSMLHAMLELDRRNEYILIVSPQNESIFESVSGRVRFARVGRLFSSGTMRILADQLLVPGIVRRSGIDVLISPGTVGTLSPGCRQIVVVQAPLALRKVRRGPGQGTISAARAFYYDLMFDRSLRGADIVVAVSKDNASRVIEETGLPAERLRVVHEGVNAPSSPSLNASAPQGSGPYLLFVSTLYPYKNAMRLLEAWLMLRRKRDISHKLVIAGADFRGEASRLMARAGSEGAAGSLVILGNLAHERIWALYRGADVFVFPSSVESFGLPVLEAMASGTAVVASDRMSVPEVAGDAALLVNPDDTSAMADAIYSLITDKAMRSDYIARALKRASQFTWEGAASRMLAIIGELA